MSLICIRVFPSRSVGRFFIGIFTFTNSSKKGSTCHAYKPLNRLTPVNPINVRFKNLRLFIRVSLLAAIGLGTGEGGDFHHKC